MLEEAVVALVRDVYAVARVLAFDLAHRSGEDEVPLMDERNLVAHLFNLVHAVRGEENGVSGIAEFDEDVLQERGVDGVEAGEGLVHDDEFGVVQERGDELYLLLHTLGELFGLLGERFGDLQLFAPSMCALF